MNNMRALSTKFFLLEGKEQGWYDTWKTDFLKEPVCQNGVKSRGKSPVEERVIQSAGLQKRKKGLDSMSQGR